MSVGYVIKLEQGKAGRPSLEVIDRLAEALGISPIQSRHLHDLALYHRATEHVDAPAEPLVSPVMKEAANNLHPHLCGYVDEMWNILYCNSEYARIYRNIGQVGNVLSWFFMVPESRAVMLEWETEARLTVAWFRALMVRRPENPMFDEHLQELAQSPEFRRMWSKREIFMGRHSPYMLVRDLDGNKDLCLLAQVYAWPDPTQAVQTYMGIRTDQKNDSSASEHVTR